MSVKTGKVTAVTASGSGSSATLHGDGPPPWDDVWTDPPDRIWAVLVAAYTKGSDVEITYNDTTSPPTLSGAKAK